MTPAELMVLRKQYGLTQQELGARLLPPVTRLTVSNWERARFAIPVDIAARMVAVTPSPAKVKSNAALTRATVDAYRKMRNDVGHFSHAFIVGMWAEKGFAPSREAMAAIAAEFPDILTPNHKE